MLKHEVPRGHAERSERLAAVLQALAPLKLETREAPEADRADLERVHPAQYIDAMETAFARASDGLVQLDPDTFLGPHSREAIYRAAGACVAAVDAVMAGEDASAFCAVRPPGHHAEPTDAMGFCIFNNVAIAALRALDAHKLARVAVIDFDVHHGNGTQAVAEKDERLFFASTHQSPLYPGTGFADETGINHNVLNAPLPADTDGAHWRNVMEREVLPTLDRFEPELILVSAGFDAHKADPLAQMALEEADYAWAGKRLKELALQHCKGRVVSTLEGGYDLRALGRSAAAFVGAF
jgi:acetoin utilization deacetylase AcuC-like enzyme